MRAIVGISMTRAAMWVLLAVVAGAAAVLSFSALRDLAILCGFSTALAWLLPIVIDAGAAAGCLVWLGGHNGRRFARALTFVLLASSVAGNAVVHGLTAYQLAAPWWLVVAVSAAPPAVLGAVVHLAVLVGQASTPVAGDNSIVRSMTVDNAGDTDRVDPAALIESGVGRRRLARELGVSEHEARRLLAERNGAAS